MNEQKKTIERVFEAPAIVLEKTIEGTEIMIARIENRPTMQKAGRFWNALGPGLTTGASDDDPSGIATYSQTGAQYGLQLLWLAPLTFPLMAIVQEMCARIGLVTGQGLAANIRRHYSPWVMYLCTSLLFIANTFNIGADLGAMAAGARLLFPQMQSGFLVVVFALVCLGLEIFTTYAKYARYLKWLAFILLAYIFSAFSLSIDWGDVLTHTALPSIDFSKDQLILICAILGTTISPYLFFWQTSQEIEDQILLGRTQEQIEKEETTDADIRKMRIDIWSGMFLSNVVMFFIIVTCAVTLYSHGITNITSAADAAAALRPFAGEYTYLLFSLGIIGTGMLAVPVLAGSASYAISESAQWTIGLYQKLKDAYAFYGVIIFSTIIGLGLNFIHIDPIQALLYAAVANGIISPVVLIFIVLLSSDKAVMGKNVNKKSTTILGWIVTGVMVIAGVAAIVSLI